MGVPTVHPRSSAVQRRTRSTPGCSRIGALESLLASKVRFCVHPRCLDPNADHRPPRSPPLPRDRRSPGYSSQRDAGDGTSTRSSALHGVRTKAFAPRRSCPYAARVAAFATLLVCWSGRAQSGTHPHPTLPLKGRDLFRCVCVRCLASTHPHPTLPLKGRDLFRCVCVRCLASTHPHPTLPLKGRDHLCRVRHWVERPAYRSVSPRSHCGSGTLAPRTAAAAGRAPPLLRRPRSRRR
jgi:hypothetical protein